MLSLARYTAVSVLATAGVVWHAFTTRGQFYPAMLYLSTSKFSIVVLGNMALVLTILFGQLIKRIFLGTLREAEVERLNERSKDSVMETCLAMTIFRDDFNISFVAMFTSLLFVKIFHWLAQDRVEYIETTPTVSRLNHLRIMTFLAILLAVDICFLKYAVGYIMENDTSVLLLFAFEYVILASATVATFIKYALFLADNVLEGRWDGKGVYVFYLELVTDLLHLFVYLVFFLIIFVNYGLPLHLVRDLYWTFRNFKARVADFIRYRRVTANMNERFPDATAEELSQGDATCIICRDEMLTAKKLPCSHLFHLHCLRSWLARQQTCPTCRAPVVAPTPPPASNPAPAPDAAAGDGVGHGNMPAVQMPHGAVGLQMHMHQGAVPHFVAVHGAAEARQTPVDNAALQAQMQQAAVAQYGQAWPGWTGGQGWYMPYGYYPQQMFQQGFPQAGNPQAVPYAWPGYDPHAGQGQTQPMTHEQLMALGARFAASMAQAQLTALGQYAQYMAMWQAHARLPTAPNAQASTSSTAAPSRTSQGVPAGFTTAPPPVPVGTAQPVVGSPALRPDPSTTIAGGPSPLQQAEQQLQQPARDHQADDGLHETPETLRRRRLARFGAEDAAAQQ
eukprot:jgi/Chlat1/7833/Chrsp66S07282